MHDGSNVITILTFSASDKHGSNLYINKHIFMSLTSRFHFQFSYSAATANQTGSLTVLWDGDHHVDTTNVTLYKCGVLGSHRGHADCSLCVTRDARYNCAWCGDRCEYAPNCARRQDNCGKPTITKVGHGRVTSGLSAG